LKQLCILALVSLALSFHIQERVKETLNKGQQENVFIVFKQHVDFTALQKL